MTILPKTKQPKSSGSGSSCASNTNNTSSSSSSSSSSPNTSDVPVVGSSAIGSVVGHSVVLTGSKRSREVASSVEPGGGQGSADSGPTSTKRRHHHRNEVSTGSSCSSTSDNNRGSERSRHAPYIHLSKKISGKSFVANSSSVEVNDGVVKSLVTTSVTPIKPGICADSIKEPSTTVPSGSRDLNNCTATATVEGVSLNSSTDESTVASSTSPPGSPTGYNSGDEYGTNDNRASRGTVWTPEQLIEVERRFEKKLRKKALMIVKMGEDGACLFRAVADQVYGDQEMHGLVRKLCCDYMMKNSDYFSQYVTEDFEAYVSRKRRDHIQGNHVELQALSEMFARPIEVYHYSTEPINIFQSGQDDEMILGSNNDEPIRLSYHSPGLVDSGHYNSLRSARVSFKPKATLIHYTPPQVLESAIRSSESDALEKAMLEDKLRATDWEATNEALEEQVARESYLEWVRETEQRKRMNSENNFQETSNCVNAMTSSTITKSPSQEGGNSPKAGGSGSYTNWSDPVFRPSNSQAQKTSAYTSIDPEVAAMVAGSSLMGRQTAETEREILARVMLESRQEYLDSLKARKTQQQSRGPKSPNYHFSHRTRSSSRSSSPSSSCNKKEKTPPPSSSRN